MKVAFMETLNQLYKLKISHQLGQFLEGELAVLMMLNQSGAILPSVLSERLGISRARMSVLIKNLEKKDFIHKEHVKNDKRKWLLSLSQKGYDYTNQKAVEVDAYIDQYLSALGEEDTKSMIKLLQKSYTIMEAMSDE